MLSPHSKTTAVVAGAGAVENAWAPILRALEPWHDFPLTPDGANSFLARLVYLLRWWSSDPSELGRRELESHLKFLRAVRSAIATELQAAEAAGEIKARHELKLLLHDLLLPFGRRFILVTTNWDSVVKCAIENILYDDYRCEINPLHIHGSVRDPNTLYLPSEMTKEPYRSRGEEMSIGGLHGDIWRALESAHRTILYGLSLDPLDAELGQTLACGWSNPNLEEILIVNPNHESVARRVNLLLDRRRDVVVKGVNPSSMTTERDYTIWRHAKSNKT
jgi:hypothetical protein